MLEVGNSDSEFFSLEVRPLSFNKECQSLRSNMPDTVFEC